MIRTYTAGWLARARRCEAIARTYGPWLLLGQVLGGLTVLAIVKAYP
jgi:hypothetical protein